MDIHGLSRFPEVLGMSWIFDYFPYTFCESQTRRRKEKIYRTIPEKSEKFYTVDELK